MFQYHYIQYTYTPQHCAKALFQQRPRNYSLNIHAVPWPSWMSFAIISAVKSSQFKTRKTRRSRVSASGFGGGGLGFRVEGFKG